MSSGADGASLSSQNQHQDQTGQIVPKDVLENIYAHSHSFSLDTSAMNNQMGAAASPDHFSNLSSSYTTTTTPSPHRKSNEMPISRYNARNGINDGSGTFTPTPQSVTSRQSKGDDTPSLRMDRPPSNYSQWGERSYCLDDGSARGASHDQLITTALENTKQHEIRQRLAHPPGIKLIAHGTKCNPRHVWVTLHFDDATSLLGAGGSGSPSSMQSPESSTITFEYRNCLTWRAEMKQSTLAASTPPLAPTTKPRLGNLRKVAFADILGIELGKRTTALRRVQTAQYVNEDECFSLLTRTGTLDLQCVGFALTKSVGAEDGASAATVREGFITNLTMAMSSKGLKLNGLQQTSASYASTKGGGEAGILNVASTYATPSPMTLSQKLTAVSNANDGRSDGKEPEKGGSTFTGPVNDSIISTVSF